MNFKLILPSRKQAGSQDSARDRTLSFWRLYTRPTLNGDLKSYLRLLLIPRHIWVTDSWRSGSGSLCPVQSSPRVCSRLHLLDPWKPERNLFTWNTYILTPYHTPAVSSVPPACPFGGQSQAVAAYCPLWLWASQFHSALSVQSRKHSQDFKHRTKPLDILPALCPWVGPFYCSCKGDNTIPCLFFKLVRVLPFQQ